MSLEGEAASYRILLRTMAPNIRGVFEQVKAATGESEYNFELVVGYARDCHKDHTKANVPEHKCDFDDHTNNKMMLKHIVTGEKYPLENDPNKKAAAQQDGMSAQSMFPVIKNLIEDCAAEWTSEQDPVTPWDVLLYLKLIRPKAEGLRETMELKAKMKSKKSNPNRERKEFII